MRVQFRNKPFLVVFSILLILLIGVQFSCKQDAQVESFTEESAVPAPASAKDPHAGLNMPATSSAPSHFQWKTPEGWLEDNKSSGFRLASFIVKDGTDESVCTIIPLQGEAGGLKANIMRWMGQIGAQLEDGPQLDEFVAKQERFLTDGNFPAVLVDLTPLTTDPTGKSVLATVVTVAGNSIFIKMTGPKKQLELSKEKFRVLSRSFSGHEAGK